MTIELNADDAGASRSVRVGERASVRLPESPTTGYRWQAEYDDAAVKLVDDRSEAAQVPRGAGGDRVLVFEALRPGAVHLRLAKRRSWEKGEPVEEFSVDLDVQP